MFQRICAPVLALGLCVGMAQGATVGSFTFDDDAFADDAIVALTVPGTRGPAQNPAGAGDGDLSTASNLNDSFVEIFFTDNILINGPGDDIVIFSGTNNNRILLSNGTGSSAQFISDIGGANFVPVGAPGNTSGFTLNGATIDLSDLGFADGAEITDGLFLSRGGVFTTVWDVAALNSRSAAAPNPNPVPLPAGLPMLIGALGILCVLRQRRG